MQTLRGRYVRESCISRIGTSFCSHWGLQGENGCLQSSEREHTRKLDFVCQGAMQSPQKWYGQAQNKEIRDRVKHANGDELCVEINATGLGAGIPIRADRHTLKYDHEGTRNAIAQDESCSGP